MYKRILTILGGILLTFTLAAGTARAEVITAGPLTIEYSGSGPIFSEPDLAPGDMFVKQLSVTNNGTIVHSFAISATNVSGDLSDKINIMPELYSVELWSETILALSQLPEQSKIVIPSIDPGETIAVNLIAKFDSQYGNELQDKVVTFDLVVGSEEAEPSATSSATPGTSGVTTTTLTGGLFGVSALSGDALAATTGGLASPTATATATATTEVDESGDVLGAEDQDSSKGLNGLLLLIPPVALILSVPFVSPGARNAVIPTLGAGATAVLAFFTSGDMPPVIFWSILIAEVILILLLDYFIVKKTVTEVLEEEEVLEKKARRAHSKKRR